MSPPAAITLAYGVVWAAILLYLWRLRRRLRQVEADVRAQRTQTRSGEALSAR